MKSKEKKMIIEILQTTVESIKYAFTNKQYIEQCINDCSDAVATINNFLVNKKNPKLDEIILNLSNISNEILSINYKEDTNRSLEALANSISKVIDEIRSIKSKKVMMFLPYKASMWTSLESIWIAANNDQDCEAMVMVLPYYELDIYGNKIKMVYEGYKFPPNVPIVDYSKVDISQILPDVIFVHNLYDEDNNFTRIPEQYYIDNLKKYADCVVYSPYFTFATYGENYSGIQFEVPSAYKVDNIVVQSKRVADIYQKYGHESSKFVVTGSPKFDSILKSMNKEINIPNQWKDKLENKTVFLLNTHMSYFPKSFQTKEQLGDYALKRHREIIEAFVDKPGCGLIWRPHPLLRPFLENRFNECLEFLDWMESVFENSCNCVIDTSEDYTTSFNISSALISTYSSIVNEYLITEKPVLLFQTAPKEKDAEISPCNYRVNYFRFEPDKLSFENFRDMILKGEDPKKNQRLEMIKNSFLNLDSTCGEKTYLDICNRLDFNSGRQFNDN